MTRNVAVFVLAASSFLASRASAQVAPPAPDRIAVGEWRLAPVVEAKVRGEARHDLDSEDRGTLVERARLGVDASREMVEMRVVLQDARSVDIAAGNNPLGGPPASAVTGAYEAWAEVQNGAFRPSYVRVGRQAVEWGEGRLLGRADWLAGGRSLDAARGRLVVGDGAVEILGAVLEDDAAVSALPNAYGELFGALFQWSWDPLFAVDAYGLVRLAQANPGGLTSSLNATVEGQTYVGAIHLGGDGQEWKWGADGAYELGWVQSLAAERAAFAASAYVARTFVEGLWRPTAEIGLSYASGDDTHNRGATYRAFDPVLPDVRVWHGAMDLLSWSNEAEAHARARVVPFSDSAVSIEYRYARLAEARGLWRSANLFAIGQATTQASNDLGHEIDAAFDGSPLSSVRLEAGYSLFILGQGARDIVGAATATRVSHFGFAEAAVTF